VREYHLAIINKDTIKNCYNNGSQNDIGYPGSNPQEPECQQEKDDGWDHIPAIMMPAIA
jgi:hypothetical protein